MTSAHSLKISLCTFGTLLCILDTFKDEVFFFLDDIRPICRNCAELYVIHGCKSRITKTEHGTDNISSMTCSGPPDSGMHILHVFCHI